MVRHHEGSLETGKPLGKPWVLSFERLPKAISCNGLENGAGDANLGLGAANGWFRISTTSDSTSSHWATVVARASQMHHSPKNKSELGIAMKCNEMQSM